MKRAIPGLIRAEGLLLLEPPCESPGVYFTLPTIIPSLFGRGVERRKNHEP